MKLDTDKLGTEIAAAIKGVFSDEWPEIREYAQAEANKLAQTLAMIEALKAAGKINEQQAELHLQIQKNAMRSVLLTLEGLGMLAVENAINAALLVVKDTVNTALGFRLI